MLAAWSLCRAGDGSAMATLASAGFQPGQGKRERSDHALSVCRCARARSLSASGARLVSAPRQPDACIYVRQDGQLPSGWVAGAHLLAEPGCVLPEQAEFATGCCPAWADRGPGPAAAGLAAGRDPVAGSGPGPGLTAVPRGGCWRHGHGDAPSSAAGWLAGQVSVRLLASRASGPETRWPGEREARSASALPDQHARRGRNGRLVVSARVRGVVLHGLHAAGGQGALGAARQEPPGRVVSAQGSVEVGQRQAAGECVPVLAGA